MMNVEQITKNQFVQWFTAVCLGSASWRSSSMPLHIAGFIMIALSGLFLMSNTQFRDFRVRARPLLRLTGAIFLSYGLFEMVTGYRIAGIAGVQSSQGSPTHGAFVFLLGLAIYAIAAWFKRIG
jgi:hypothetical protein